MAVEMHGGSSVPIPAPLPTAATTYAGCLPRPTAVVVAAGRVWFLGPSCIAVHDGNSVVDIVPLDSPGTCICAVRDTIFAGTTSGGVFAVKNSTEPGTEMTYTRNATLTDAIQCCAALSPDCFAAATLESIFWYATGHTWTYAVPPDDIPAAAAFIEHSGAPHLLVGTAAGRLLVLRPAEHSTTLTRVAAVEAAHRDALRTIAVASDGTIATGAKDGSVRCWRFDGTLVLEQTLAGHEDWVNALLWDGGVLYSASADKTAKRWQRGGDGSYAADAISSCAAECLGLALWDGDVLIHTRGGGIDRHGFDATPPRYFASGHTEAVAALDWRAGPGKLEETHQGRCELLLTASADCTSRIFRDGVECGRPQTHGYPLACACFVPGQRLRIASGAQEPIIRIMEATQLFFRLSGARSLAADETDSYVPTATLAELDLTNENRQGCTEDPLSETVLATNVFQEVKKVYGHYFGVSCITANSRFLFSSNRAVSGRHAGLFIWTHDGQAVGYEKGHRLGIVDIAATETHVLTAARDGDARLYCVVAGGIELLRVHQNAHDGPLRACALADAHVATAGHDRRVCIYSIASGERLASIEADDDVHALAFAPQSGLLALGCGRHIRLFDQALKEVAQWEACPGKISVLRFNGDGTRLAVGSNGGIVRVYDCE